MLQDAWVWWADDVFRGQEGLAVLALFFIAVGFFWISPRVVPMGKFGRSAHRDLFDQIKSRAPAGMSNAEIEVLVREEISRRRAAITDIPAVKPTLAARPDDGRNFVFLTKFVQDKYDRSIALIPEEQFLRGPLALVARLLGPEGLSHLDSFGEQLPYKGWELRQALEKIDAPEMGGLIERSVAIYLHRLQLTRDMTATGMPIAQARAHKDMPQYTELESQLAQLGGLESFQSAADRYLDQNYPWADAVDLNTI